MPNIKLKDLTAPLRDRRFRPLFVYQALSYSATMSSVGFLSVYQLNVLGLSHTFITSAGILASLAGMAGIWAWGRVADRAYWTPVVLATRALSTVCFFGWAALPTGLARAGALVLMLLTAVGEQAVGMSLTNLQYDNCPARGKTAYLGVTAALASLIGYGVSLVGSGVQDRLEGAIYQPRPLALHHCICQPVEKRGLYHGALPVRHHRHRQRAV